MGQLTIRQLREHGILPDTSLGQHFLVDDNILRVAGDLASLDAADVVYEPGAGVGVLTAFLASRVAHVHTVEIDRRLQPALEFVTREYDNVTIHWGDALGKDPAALEPAPTKLVSNLPYHVAAPIVAETLQHVSSIRTITVMVQREVADRMAAPVGGKVYGALSVLVQTVTERTGTHQVSRSVFAPPPNVDSTLIAFRRRDEDGGLAPGEVPAYAAFLKDAFAQRRKTLANNLQPRAGAREPVVEALAALGHQPAARVQELSPLQFVAMFRALAGGADG